ncbi:MAG: helix-turn-helix domain-containing protein [Gemmatimonadota bacterium]|nr:helix-turn-helix domain-containing protein [Gemmatimonadota bacterium]
MATDVARLAFQDEAPADLTALGKHLEILRIHRGLSKQGLARTAGTSRQQLWRVMTGKSELTSSLKQRLAGALAVEPTSLASNTSSHADATYSVYSPAPTPPLSMAEFLADSQHLQTTLRTLPAEEGGRRVKRALLATIEEIAVDTGHALPADFPEIRQRILSGEV